jgi:hypothetical protein
MSKHGWRWGLALAAIGGLSGCGYSGGSYRFFGHDLKGERLSGACLDLAVSRHVESRRFAPVVTYAMGNRCDDDALIDLRRAHVWAHAITERSEVAGDGSHAGSAGGRIPLMPRDPRHELRPASLAGAWVAWVSVEYELEHVPATLPALREICVDAAGVAVGIAGVVCFDPEAS